jgi:hypothetical protein
MRSCRGDRVCLGTHGRYNSPRQYPPSRTREFSLEMSSSGGTDLALKRVRYCLLEGHVPPLSPRRLEDL